MNVADQIVSFGFGSIDLRNKAFHLLNAVGFEKAASANFYEARVMGQTRE
jgi:hypothetical protein